MKKFLVFVTGVLVGALGYAAYKYVTEPADEVPEFDDTMFDDDDDTFFDDKEDIEIEAKEAASNG